MWNSQILRLVLYESTLPVYILRLMIDKMTNSHYCLWSIIGWMSEWSTYLWMDIGYTQFYFNEGHSLHWHNNASYDNISLDPTQDVLICPAVDNLSVMHNCMDVRRHWCVASTFFWPRTIWVCDARIYISFCSICHYHITFRVCDARMLIAIIRFLAFVLIEPR